MQFAQLWFGRWRKSQTVWKGDYKGKGSKTVCKFFCVSCSVRNGYPSFPFIIFFAKMGQKTLFPWRKNAVLGDFFKNFVHKGRVPKKLWKSGQRSGITSRRPLLPSSSPQQRILMLSTDTGILKTRSALKITIDSGCFPWRSSTTIHDTS